MNAVEGGQKVLSTLLNKLGLESEVAIEDAYEGTCLQISSEHGRYLIGRGGDRLDDMQYLVNRIVQKHLPDAPRLRVDCDHYRQENEDRLIQSVTKLANEVKETGEAQKTKPLNAYHRRIVHNALKEQGVITDSENSKTRFKKILISPAE